VPADHRNLLFIFQLFNNFFYNSELAGLQQIRQIAKSIGTAQGFARKGGIAVNLLAGFRPRRARTNRRRHSGKSVQINRSLFCPLWTNAFVIPVG
jgi:hypothetical protein